MKRQAIGLLFVLFIVSFVVTGILTEKVKASDSVNYTYYFDPTGYSSCGNESNAQFKMLRSGNEIEVRVRKCDGSFSRDGVAVLYINDLEYGHGAQQAYSAGDPSVEPFYINPIVDGYASSRVYNYVVKVGEDSNLATGDVNSWVEFSLPTTTPQFPEYTYSVNSQEYICGPTGAAALKLQPDGNRIQVLVRKCQEGEPFQRAGEAVLYVDEQVYGISQTYPQGDTLVSFYIDPASQGFPDIGQHDYLVKVGEDANLLTGTVTAWVVYDEGGNGEDEYEPDNIYTQATWIYNNSPQNHSIVPADDIDWVRFSLSTETGITIGTSGVSGDTRMWLYDSELNEIAFNDDDGQSSFSKITRSCDYNPLPAGIYYVKVDEYQNNNEIPNYTISLVEEICIGDETKPSGEIKIPENQITITGKRISIYADAWDNPGGSGVKTVAFYVFYNSLWHHVGNDNLFPYEVVWSVPDSLGSQEVQFGLHVEDNAGNYAIDPTPPIVTTYIPTNPSKDLWLPYSYQAGPIRVNRTGWQYSPYYLEAGLQSVVKNNCAGILEAYCYCNSSDECGGDFHFAKPEAQFLRAAFDFQLPYGSSVLAAKSGIVIQNGEEEPCTVAIAHDDGSGTAYYLHLSEIHVSKNQHVEAGEYIANSGDCNADGAHLHFAVFQGNVEVESHFADSSAQVHGGILRPSRSGYREYRYQADGDLVVNYETGSPGSYFTVTGTRYQANTTIEISLNGIVVGYTDTDEDGDYLFILSTEFADTGIYNVSPRIWAETLTGILVEIPTTRFIISSYANHHPLEDDGPIFTVPEGISIRDDSIRFVPMLIK